MDLLAGVALVCILLYLMVRLLADYDLSPLAKVFDLKNTIKITIKIENDSASKAPASAVKTNQQDEPEQSTNRLAPAASFPLNDVTVAQKPVTSPQQPIRLSKEKEQQIEEREKEVAKNDSKDAVAIGQPIERKEKTDSHRPAESQGSKEKQNEVTNRPTSSELPEVLESLPGTYPVDSGEDMAFDLEPEIYPDDNDVLLDVYVKKIEGVNVEVKRIARIFKRKYRTIEKDSDQLITILNLLWKKEDVKPFDVNVEKIYAEAFSDENQASYMDMYYKLMNDFENVPADIVDSESIPEAV